MAENHIIKEIIDKAVFYHKNHKLKEATVEYLKLIEIKPDFIDAMFNLGNIYIQLNKYKLAKNYFEKIISLEANNEKALNSLAITHYNMREVEKAKFFFRKIINLNINNYQAYYNLGNILNEEEEYEEAIKLFEKCIKINPNHSNAYNNMGLAYNKLSLTDEAKKYLEISLKINPNNFYSYNNLGIVHDNTYNTPEAKKNFKKAISINDKFVEAWWNLQCCSKNNKEALEILEKIHKIDNKHLKATILISAIKGFNGDLEQYKKLINSNHNTHPYLRSVKWVLSLRKLPKLFFNKWDLFDYVSKLSDTKKPFYEFGVRFGHSFKYLIKIFKKGYGFDTFTGLPEDWHHSKPKGSYSSFGIVPKIKGGEFIVGKFEDSLPNFFSKKREIASVINFDADLYSSTICSLNYSKPIIDRKTILVFDEFLMNSNWEKDEFKALNEFCENNNYKYDVIAVSFYTKQVAVRIRKKIV